MSVTEKPIKTPTVPLSFGKGSKGARQPVKSIVDALRSQNDKLSHQAANLIDNLLTENAKLRSVNHEL